MNKKLILLLFLISSVSVFAMQSYNTAYNDIHNQAKVYCKNVGDFNTHWWNINLIDKLRNYVPNACEEYTPYHEILKLNQSYDSITEDEDWISWYTTHIQELKVKLANELEFYTLNANDSFIYKISLPIADTKNQVSQWHSERVAEILKQGDFSLMMCSNVQSYGCELLNVTKVNLSMANKSFGDVK